MREDHVLTVWGSAVAKCSGEEAATDGNAGALSAVGSTTAEFSRRINLTGGPQIKSSFFGGSQTRGSSWSYAAVSGFAIKGLNFQISEQAGDSSIEVFISEKAEPRSPKVRKLLRRGSG